MPTLIKLLDREGIHSRVRMRVAETVGVIGNNMSSVNERRPIAERLVGLLGEERIDPNVRHSIAKAVGVIGEPSVIPDLVELRGKESIDLYVRMSVAETVAALQNRQLHET